MKIKSINLVPQYHVYLYKNILSWKPKKKVKEMLGDAIIDQGYNSCYNRLTDKANSRGRLITNYF